MAFGVITSAYRTPAHNRFVGGVPNSHHLYGRALDVARRPGVSHRMVEEALRRAGFRLIESLDEGDHSHFAFATSLARPLPVAALPSTPTAPPAAVAAAPAKPLRPVLADQHGTLMVADATLAGPAAGNMLAPGGQ
ncbi:D-Ala-D-Ala carboxypeptidase family metallohydrolase [Sphingomonas arenae]|uniref:D-Ala-D-Ala carboxypeptidase family metallohydrolase n=1 Tax=Sphingomonas arenae TaxID=2812555 RepID=UPI00196705DB|nr:D-Ala-D-Ala carboxypeptidase family metallohydrolase [Sphingomonas arenae]